MFVKEVIHDDILAKCIVLLFFMLNWYEELFSLINDRNMQKGMQ